MTKQVKTGTKATLAAGVVVFAGLAGAGAGYAQQAAGARQGTPGAVTEQAHSPTTAAAGQTPAVGTPADARAAAHPLAQVLDGYVRDALRSNLSLQSQSLEVERNLALLDAARV